MMRARHEANPRERFRKRLSRVLPTLRRTATAPSMPLSPARKFADVGIFKKVRGLCASWNVRI